MTISDYFKSWTDSVRKDSGQGGEHFTAQEAREFFGIESEHGVNMYPIAASDAGKTGVVTITQTVSFGQK